MFLHGAFLCIFGNMNINEIFEYYNFVLNKNQEGYTTGDEFTRLFNQEQNSYYDFLIGHVEQFQYARPVPRVGISMSEHVDSRLAPFLKPISGASVSAQSVTKPGDFYRLAAMRTGTNGKIDRVMHDRLANRIASEVMAGVPFYVEYADQWMIWPSTVTTVNYEYYPKAPAAAVWGYDTVSGRQVYDAGQSTDPLWSDTEISAILGRMFRKVGIRLADQGLAQLGQTVINTGE